MAGPRRPRLAWVSLGPEPHSRPLAAAPPALWVPSLADLLAGPKADLVVLAGGPGAVGPALQHLRGQPAYALSLIYVSASPDGWAEPKADPTSEANSADPRAHSLVEALGDGPPPQGGSAQLGMASRLGIASRLEIGALAGMPPKPARAAPSALAP